MPIYECEVLNDEGPPHTYVEQAKFKWQAQLIAFLKDGGLGDEPDEQPLDSCVELAKMYTSAREL